MGAKFWWKKILDVSGLPIDIEIAYAEAQFVCDKLHVLLILYKWEERSRLQLLLFMSGWRINLANNNRRMSLGQQVFCGKNLLVW